MKLFLCTLIVVLLAQVAWACLCEPNKPLAFTERYLRILLATRIVLLIWAIGLMLDELPMGLRF